MRKKGKKGEKKGKQKNRGQSLAKIKKKNKNTSPLIRLHLGK